MSTLAIAVVALVLASFALAPLIARWLHTSREQTTMPCAWAGHDDDPEDGEDDLAALDEAARADREQFVAAWNRAYPDVHLAVRWGRGGPRSR